MFAFSEEIFKEIDGCEEYARLIEKKIQEKASGEVLVLDVQGLETRIKKLAEMLPDGVTTGNAFRHLNFLKKYVGEGTPEHGLQDAHEIGKYDLDVARQGVRRWCAELAFADDEFRRGVLPLIRMGEFDSAVRKAFVILKERLCDKFKLSHDLDGVELVNRVFGSKSELSAHLSDSDKQACRDFFAGLFGISRRRLAHNDHKVGLAELEMVVSSVNYCLQIISDCTVSGTNKGIICPKK